MTSYYSLLQIAPDPLADERINLGFVALSDTDGRLEFAADASRAAMFLGGGTTASDVTRLVEAVRADIEPLLTTGYAVDDVRHLSERWHQTVRITTPRASTLALDDLVASIGPRVLPQVPSAPAKQSRARDRRAAVALAHRTLIKALDGAPKKLKLSRRVTVAGRHQPHRFDLGLENGVVRLGVNGLSFEGRSTPDREHELGALNWLVDDVKAANADFPISVIVLSPGLSRSANEKLDVLRDLGAEVVREPDVGSWAGRVVQQVA